MTLTRDQRRLAAIVAADVIGYSRLMERDESGTVARLREHRQKRLEPVLTRYGGRLVKLIGDGALVEFPSAVDALGASIEFQQAMAEANASQPEDTWIVFRIGLHLGDLIVDGDDLYGDGVNVAARLEAEAPPGGILISGDVHNAVAGRLKATFVALGELSLKNIERPVRAFRVQMDDILATATSAGANNALLTLPDKPSIAVLPFKNMSGDPEQEYFVDGLVEDMITGLSRFKSLFVIAQNSTFAYKGKSPDIRQVGRELGVRYVLEGSVRKVGNRIRITGQLVDAANGTHLWADRFDGALEDVFELQDRVSANVVGIIAPRVEQAEIERVRSKPASNLEAYDLVLRAGALMRTLRRPEMEQALGLLRQAVDIDPSYARGTAFLAQCCWTYIAQGFGHRDNPLVADMKEVAQRALALDPADSGIVDIAAVILGVPGGDMESGIALVEKAIGLNRNNADAFRAGAILYAYKGEIDKVVEHQQQAERLNPLDASWRGSLAYPIAYFGVGDHEKSWIGQRASFASNPIPVPRFVTARRALHFSAA